MKDTGNLFGKVQAGVKKLIKIAVLITVPPSFGVLYGAAPDADFSRDGLVLWLDAALKESVVRNSNGAVTEWRDRSGRNNHAVNRRADGQLKYIENGFGKNSAIGFNGQDFLQVATIRNQPGDVAVFIVYKRTDAGKNEGKWQRLLSSSDCSTADDRLGVNFCLVAKDGKVKPEIVNLFANGKIIGPLSIGRNQRNSGQFFTGCIGEILVFDREFLTENAINRVNDYLTAKWHATAPRKQGWTLVGALKNLPSRTTDQLPLSDQINRGGWQKYEPLWDEFNTDRLNPTQWWQRNPEWKGREPGLFMAKNAVVKDGELQLYVRREEPPNGTDKKYHTLTSAAVQSKTRVKYGYFEIEAKPADAQVSSAFWFYFNTPDEWTEIDVFELGGGAPGIERDFGMNLHVFRKPEDKDKKNHWRIGGNWVAPWKFADDFHVFGLEWNKDFIRYYVDGVLVRQAANTAWHQPLTLNFTIEVMVGWMGMPKATAPFPQVFRIKYVRAWKKADQQEKKPLPGYTVMK